MVRDVAELNLLGDGSIPSWKDHNFIRDSVFTDKKSCLNTILSLRLVQYSLGDTESVHKDFLTNPKLKQWIECLKSAHKQSAAPASIDEPTFKKMEVDVVNIQNCHMTNTGLHIYF